MGCGSDARIPQFCVSDKAERSRRPPVERRIADGRPEPVFRPGQWQNWLSSGRTSRVVWLELITREHSMPETPRAAATAPRSAARCRRIGPLEWRASPYGEASLRWLTQPTNDPLMAPTRSARAPASRRQWGDEQTRLNGAPTAQVDPKPPSMQSSSVSPGWLRRPKKSSEACSKHCLFIKRGAIHFF
jgi:hypothetical protein